MTQTRTPTAGAAPAGAEQTAAATAGSPPPGAPAAQASPAPPAQNAPAIQASPAPPAPPAQDTPATQASPAPPAQDTPATSSSDGEAARPSWRQQLADRVEAPRFQNLVMVVIMVNSVSIGVETAVSPGSLAHQVLRLVDHVCLAVFMVEIALKLVAAGPRRFVRSGWNVFDLLVVAVALVPGAGPLSVLRTLRILRLLRVIRFLPSLRRVVEALVLSLPGISAIAVLMVMIFYVAAVMATAMFGEAFPDWFGSLGRSLYTLFQVMTLESWSMGIVRPVMEHSPWAWAFFVPFILVSAFTMLNLFVAVIVDTMAQVSGDPAGQARQAGPAPQPEQAGAADTNQPDQADQPEPAPQPEQAGPTPQPEQAGAADTNQPDQPGPALQPDQADQPGQAAGLAEVLSELRALRQEVAALRLPADPPGNTPNSPNARDLSP